MAVAVAPPMLVRFGVRSCMAPAEVHRKACGRFAVVSEKPTTAPESLMPFAALHLPPSEPSQLTPAGGCHRKPCGTLESAPVPTTSPELLMPVPVLFVPAITWLCTPLRRFQTET